MVYTDYSVDSVVAPQDGGWDGISDDPDADWINAAISGALAKAQGTNYAPDGLSVAPDFANNQFTVGTGTAFLEITQSVDYRNYDDSEINRSRVWEDGFLTLCRLDTAQTLSLEATSASNYVWLFYKYPGTTATGQNDAYLRVADSQTDSPGHPAVMIAELDGGTETYRETNRVAGYKRNYLGKFECADANSFTITVPETYDEIILKFQRATGDYSGGRQRLYGRVNGLGTGYYQRTTQGSNTGISNFWLTDDYPARSNIIGEVRMTGRWPDTATWSFSNGLTNRAGKYFAYGGWNNNVSSGGTLDTITLEWQSGLLTGTFALWGRDFV